jgi:hypothetical protein
MPLDLTLVFRRAIDCGGTRSGSHRGDYVDTTE